MSQGAVSAMPLVNGSDHMASFGSSKNQLFGSLVQYRDEVLSGRLHPPEILPTLLNNAARLLSSGATLPRPLAPVTTHENSNGFSQSTSTAKAGPSFAASPREPRDLRSSFPTIDSTQSNAAQPPIPQTRSKNQPLKQPHQTKSQESKDDAEPEDPLLPYIDVGQLLDQALKQVPPVSAFNPPPVNSNGSNESFDENSLYSSQGWSPTGANGKPGDGERSNGSDMMDISDEGEIYEPSHSIPANVADASNSDQASYGNEDAEEEYEPYVPDDPQQAYQDVDMLEYADDEADDYSPPPPDPYAYSSTQSANMPNQFRGLEPPPMADQYYTRRGKSSYNKRPNAQGNGGQPGPSRQRPQGWQKRHTQEEPRQNLHVSKKRRYFADRETGQRTAGKRKAASPAEGSPEPYIKPEPVSPPPFSFEETAPSRNSRRAARQVAEDIEMDSPRIVRRRSDYQSGYESAYDDYGSSSNGYEAGTLRSPATFRRLQRDDRDLRRVASLQHARRPRTPEMDTAEYRESVRQRTLSDRQASREKVKFLFEYDYESESLQCVQQLPSWTRIGETLVDGQLVPVIQTKPESPPKLLFVDQNGTPYYNKRLPNHEPVILKPQRKPTYPDGQYIDYARETAAFRQSAATAIRGGMEPPTYYARAATQQPVSYRQVHVPEADDYARMPPPQVPRNSAFVEATVREILEGPTQYDPARPATSRHEIFNERHREAFLQRLAEETFPRAYSVLPEPSVRQETTYQQAIPTQSQSIGASIPQPDNVPRAFSVRPDLSAPRDNAAYAHQPSGYIQNTTTEPTYPARAYSVVPPSVSRNQALEQLRTRYDPPASSYPAQASTSMPHHGRTFSGGNAAGSSNQYAGPSQGGYPTYR